MIRNVARREDGGGGGSLEDGGGGAGTGRAARQHQRGRAFCFFVLLFLMALPTFAMFGMIKERIPARAMFIKRFMKRATNASAAQKGLLPKRRTPPPAQIPVAEGDEPILVESRVTQTSSEAEQEKHEDLLPPEKSDVDAAVSGKAYKVESYTDTSSASGAPGHGVTLVTAYFRIKSKHSDAQYDTWMSNTMSVLDPMVIFTSHDMVERMRGLRAHAKDRTLVIPFELNSTRMATTRSSEFWEKQRMLDPEAARHRSAELYWIWNEKPRWMANASEANPFGTRYFCWIDTGYLRHDKLNGRHLVARMPADLLDNQVMFLNIGRFKESDFVGGTLVTGNRVSGNLFGGTSASLSWWSRQFYEAFDDYADHGLFAGKDQHMMATACARSISRCYLVQPVYEGRRLDRIERWFVMAFLLNGLAPMHRVGGQKVPNAAINGEGGVAAPAVHVHHHHHRLSGSHREHPAGSIVHCNTFVVLPWMGKEGAAEDEASLLSQVHETMWGKGGGQKGGGGRCKHWNDIDRSNGTHHISFRGRMSNGIIEYFYTRIAADAAGVGIFSEGQGGEHLKSFYQNIEFEPGGERRVVPANKKCGPHFQSYGFFRYERCLAQCVLAPTHMTLSPAIFALKGKDAVIHFRRPFFQFKGKNPHGIRRHTAWHTTPTFDYFSSILDDLKRRDNLGTVYIVAEPGQREDEIVQQILEQYSAKWVAEKPAQDHYLCRVAPTFIGSFGTFSWTIAYLSQAREIHLPIVSNMSFGSTWNWWDALFIEDDERITYHDEVLADWGGIGGFLNASEVMGSGTVFAHSIRNRTDGDMCDPRTDRVLAYARDKSRRPKNLYTGEEWGRGGQGRSEGAGEG